MEPSAVIVLAGGLGTRLRSAVSDVPKILAPAAGRPFLDYLVENLKRQGAPRLILSLGYGAEAVQAYLAGDGAVLCECLPIETVVEDELLGTGGAVRHVVTQTGLSGRFIISNGDTLLKDGYANLASASVSCSGSHAIMGTTMVTENVARYHSVVCEADGRISGFAYLEGAERAEINSGLVSFEVDSFLAACPESAKFSMEEDVYPELIKNRMLYAVSLDTLFIDIGVPEDYRRFERLIDEGVLP